MNKTEAAYAQRLEARRAMGEIIWWEFEGITFKLADDTRYTPDFDVLLASGAMECHETKGGHIREDSFIKIKLAARLFPFAFLLCQLPSRNADWIIKRI